MNPSYAPFTNPFTRVTFRGREKELRIIWGRLLSRPPQSVIIIGEPFIGKTGLVQHLMTAASLDEKRTENQFTFVYFDCKNLKDKEQTVDQKRARDMDDFIAAHFWWDLYSMLPGKLEEDRPFSEPERKDDASSLIDATYNISSAIEKWVQSQKQPVIFILDNFEGMARLPLRNSDRLRSIGDYCAFIITSRYALYVLHNYHLESWEKPSPFYNIFSDPIYLGLLAEQEVREYLENAALEVKKSGGCWYEQDTEFIRQVAGRHPKLLRMACSRIYEQRLLSQPHVVTKSVGATEIAKADKAHKIMEQDYTFLTLRLIEDARPLCKQLWQGLANSELYGQVGPSYAVKKEAHAPFSPHQSTMIDIAHGRGVTETKILFELEQRGLIEYVNGQRQIFSKVMQEFVFMQEEEKNQITTGKQQIAITASSNASTEKDDERSLTYLEGKVYDYLKSHLGDVCDKKEIMLTVWEGETMPSNSALQKIIERIREKIEDDPESPYKLIAVRGRGYMLRNAL